MDLIVRNARIATTPDAPPIDIGIQAGKITVLAPNLTAEGPEYDAAGLLVCAGLVETGANQSCGIKRRRSMTLLAG